MRSISKRLILSAAVLWAGGVSLSADVFFFIDPPTHGDTAHWTWRTSPPDGTSIDVFYYIDQAGSVSPFSAQEIDRIHDAAAAWSQPNSGARVRLVEVFAGGVGVIEVRRNPFDGAGGEIADSTVIFNAAHGAGLYPDGHPFHTITDGSIRIDSAETWYSGPAPGPVPAGEYDLQSAMIHNFGHTLGLGNAIIPTQTPSVMEHFLPSGTSRRPLGGIDRTAIQEIYGMPEPATWALFGVGLGLAGYVRRRQARRPPGSRA